MRRKTVGLYNPYLATMGGGERHILSILQVIAEAFDAEARIYWPDDLSDTFEKKLNIQFKEKPTFLATPFHHKKGSYERMKALAELDLLLYVTDGSYFFSSAHHTAIFCMVPDPALYRMGIMNRLKTQNNTFISNSRYTHDWLEHWKIDSTILYPYVSDAFFASAEKRPQKKRPVILTVGRFFQGLHAKRQDLAITAFMQLQEQDPRFADYQLVLAGSVDPADQETIDQLTTQIAGNPQITLAVNPPFEELVSYYRDARFYWHFAGYDVDTESHPHHVEHLGITPLEALASGCLTCCYAAGGPLELIEHQKNGILFSSIDELMSTMQDLVERTEEVSTMVSNGQLFVKEQFGYEPFKKRVIEFARPLLAASHS